MSEMTWGDLIESCRQYELFCKPRHTSLIDWFHIGVLIFYESGEIKANGITIAENRTPQQMKIIIENLKG